MVKSYILKNVYSFTIQYLINSLAIRSDLTKCKFALS